MTKPKFYITTSIVYVTAEPHIGYAMELIQADVLARNHRQRDDDVYMLTGTDEHGQKLSDAAHAAGQAPQQFVDHISQHYRTLTHSLNLNNDGFVRTTDPVHKQAAQKLWRACADDIYKGKYEGYYCVRCERYYNERDMDGQKCPIHHIDLEWTSIESYFFRQSNYAEQIRGLIESDELRIIPQKRKNEILAYIDSGLEDISISRPKTQLDWGVEVPGDAEHVMYVWFDALTNYISGVGYDSDSTEFEKWWPADIHIVGKDISRFHCVMWPAMLLSAGLTPPRAVYAHGFITDDHGEKISKSLGNVTDPNEIIELYGVDALRYYLLRHIPADDDGVFTMDLFAKAYNADLANDLGNLVSRVATMIHKYCGGQYEIIDIDRDGNGIDRLLDNCQFDQALAHIFEIVSQQNHHIEQQQPWQLFRTNPSATQQVLNRLASHIVWVAELLTPFLPDTAARISEIFKADGTVEPNPPILFPKHDNDKPTTDHAD